MNKDEFGGDLPIESVKDGMKSRKFPGNSCTHCPARFFKTEHLYSHQKQAHPGKPYSHAAEDDKHRIEYYHYATPAHPHWFVLSDKQSGKYLSNMNLNEKGEVEAIETHPKYRKQGLATKLWDYAKSTTDIGVPEPKHSRLRTKSGEEWAKKVGGEVPPRSGRLLSQRQMRFMIDFDRQ